MLRVQTKDGQEFSVPREMAQRSETLAQLMADLGDDDDAIPLDTISGAAFAKVLEYLEYHAKDAANDKTITDWDKAFCTDMGRTLVAEVTCASNYLNISSLLEATCKWIADDLRGKGPEELEQDWAIHFDEEAKETYRKETEKHADKTTPTVTAAEGTTTAEETTKSEQNEDAMDVDTQPNEPSATD